MCVMCVLRMRCSSVRVHSRSSAYVWFAHVCVCVLCVCVRTDVCV